MLRLQPVSVVRFPIVGTGVGVVVISGGDNPTG
jgi:hypothetical protein